MPGSLGIQVGSSGMYNTFCTYMNPALSVFCGFILSSMDYVPLHILSFFLPVLRAAFLPFWTFCIYFFVWIFCLCVFVSFCVFDIVSLPGCTIAPLVKAEPGMWDCGTSWSGPVGPDRRRHNLTSQIVPQLEEHVQLAQQAVHHWSNYLTAATSIFLNISFVSASVA